MSSKRNLELLTVPEVGSLEDAIGTIEGHKYDSEKVADEITKGIDAYVIQLEAKLPKMIGNISCLGEDIINISENEENRKLLTSIYQKYNTQPLNITSIAISSWKSRFQAHQECHKWL